MISTINNLFAVGQNPGTDPIFNPPPPPTDGILIENLWTKCSSANGVATLDCFPVVFSSFVRTAFILAGITTVVFIVLAGYKFLTSGGDAKQVGEARQIITYAIIGLIVILLSFVILNLIAIITGVKCIGFFGSTACLVPLP